jgi:hypothetical protein
MKLRLLLLILLSCSGFEALRAEQPPYIKVKDGVIVFTGPDFTGTSHAVKLEVILII